MTFPKPGKHILILFALIILNSGAVLPQSYNVTQYNEQSGLSNSTVWSAAQDGEGKIWFGTKNGVSVYDGLNWKIYHYSSYVSGAENVKLTCDEKGEIWSFARSTDVFISHFNGEFFEDQIHSSYFSQSRLSSFLVDTINSKRFIFASGFLGEILYCYDTTWKTLIISAKTKITRIYSATRKDNGLILATDKGLYNFSPEGNLSKIPIDLPFVAKSVFWEQNVSESRLLVCGETIFGYIKNNQFVKFTDKIVATYDENFPALSIDPDKRGGYFISNQFSLNFYSSFDNSLVTLGIVNGLIAGGATSVFVDREKNVWITTFRGVSKISTRTFINYKNCFLNSENEVSALIEYQPGKILFGGNYGLSLYDGVKYNYLRLIDSVREEARGHIRVLDLYKDKEENIWVAANVKGFFVIDKNFKISTFKDFQNMEGMATSVQQDDDGNIWLATTKHLYMYNGINVSMPNEFPYEFNVRKIIKLNNGELLFCVIGLGIYLKKEHEVKMYTSSNYNFKNVYSAYRDSEGKLYLGTGGGLCEVKNDSIEKCTLNNNLGIDRPVYLILKDDDGDIWFGTDIGVLRYDGKTLINYSTKDGLAGNEINRSGGLTDHHRRVWFGTNNGASCYQKEYDSKYDTSIASSVIIKSINSEHSKNISRQDLKYAFNDNDISFLIHGTSFIDEKENKIRWKLEGSDNQWTTARPFVSNEIIYTNLGSGTYKLLVQIRNANGIWGPVTTSPEITINKPFYLRAWFIFVCVLILGGVIYSVQHYFEQKKYNYFLKKEIARVTIELKETETNYRGTLLKEIHHRVKNNMQIISSLLSLQSNKENNAHLNELIKESQNRIRSMALIHEKLYQSKKFSELDISSYVGSLVEYLKRVFLVNTAYIKVNLNIQEVFINIDVAIACGLIINELVSNAFKYAFPDNAKGTIFVEIHKQETDTLLLSVKDNGVGIKNISALETSDSLGLKLVKMLVKQNQGEISISNMGGAFFEIKLLMKNESI
jgi:two-component sensor histidine kinase/ligand-binding sensor domain-containing protein